MPRTDTEIVFVMSYRRIKIMYNDADLHRLLKVILRHYTLPSPLDYTECCSR